MIWIICNEVIPGLDEGALRRELEAMTAGNGPSINHAPSRAPEVRTETSATREAETASVPEIAGDPRDRDDTRPEPQETKQSPIQGWTIERARADGEKAKREGRARRGMPGEIRDDQALTAAWQSAWESAEVEVAA